MVPQLSLELSHDIGGNFCWGALVEHFPLFLILLLLLFISRAIKFRMVFWFVKYVKLVGCYVFTLPFVAFLPCWEYASAPRLIGGVGIVHPQLIYFQDVLHKSLLLFAWEHFIIDKALKLRHHAASTLSCWVVTASNARRQSSIALTSKRSVVHNLEIRSSYE